MNLETLEINLGPGTMKLFYVEKSQNKILEPIVIEVKQQYSDSIWIDSSSSKLSVKTITIKPGELVRIQSGVIFWK